ncbi:MAG: preprotein translocase subunit SecA [Proteobacteria bacterium]|nr:preprotein translocase subunit SecA [Pseudomonadota bacterium]MBU1057446.1 preprotein translocase subunit SecA [Pseudomonadota bacterium]
MRPGIARGSYPERPQTSTGWLQQTTHALVGLAKTIAAPQWRFQQTLSAIKHYGRLFEKLKPKELTEKMLDIRLQLHQHGLTDDLTRQSFALIREIAARTINMRHFDCQLMGGWIMVHGKLAEMETGEGKTLTATLAAATAALAGIPVHIITVNDYLVSRDAQLMRPIYKALGLSVGTVTADLDAPARRSAYGCNITYCTNKQLAFDYLRDRILLGNDQGRLRLQLEQLHDKNARSGRLFLQGLCFAIIDEADSVLIDEARTPLIISRKANSCEEEQTYLQAFQFANTLENEMDFSIDPRQRTVRLSKRGSNRLAEMAKPIAGIWSGMRRREELVCQAISARHLYLRDRHYLVQENKVLIIDENTGRIMADRSWEHGLHQLIEIKENCEVTAPREHMARLTYQRFFRRYLRLAGMTGTAREVRRELWSTYALPVVKVPPNKPSRRREERPRLYSNKTEKWAAIVNHIQEVHLQQRPILIGTRSVADSEHLSTLLHERGLLHQVLNARQDTGEAEIVARAGAKGCITVATNMAGRGTDIPLGAGVAEIGGLHIIVSERNEAHRIDRQLYGRCGRQGDSGSYVSILSLEDELLQQHLKEPCRHLLNLLTRGPESAWQHIGLLAMRLAQSGEERRHLHMRRDLLQMDEQLGKILAFSGQIE